MYEGVINVFSVNNSYRDYDSTYYNGKIGFSITETDKLAKDKPTIVISIPYDMIGMTSLQTSNMKSASDYCLRTLAPYIDFLNEELYNRSRPDNENGKYYLYHPGGEVLTRNTAYFALCPQKDYEYRGGNSVYLLEGDPLPPKMCLCILMQVQLPKRNIRKTIQMLCRDLPDAVDMFVARFNPEKLNEALALAEKQAAVRAWLKNSDYCAFIANGSILPRSKGTDQPIRVNTER